MLGEILLAFGIALLISAVGTLPPATINIAVLQLTIRKRRKIALQLAIGAATIDLIYTIISLNISEYLTQRESLIGLFQLITSILFIVLGLASIFSSGNKKIRADQFKIIQSGWVRGILLGLFNPLIMPFWITVITYLQVNEWLILNGHKEWPFLVGTFIGEIGMLLLIIRLGSSFTKYSENKWITFIIPGIAFLILGIFSLFQYLF
ncbi:MAG: LysE family transporter [Bacteroidota bacterium]